MRNQHRVQLCKDLSGLVSDILAGSVSAPITVARLRSHALWLEELEKGFQLTGDPEAPKTKARPGPTDQEIAELFQYWRMATGRLKTKLSRERAMKLKARLTEQTMEALKSMIDWSVRDDFYSGHSDIETLFRSRDKTENYIHKSGYRFPRPAEAKAGDAIKELEKEAKSAMAEGRIDEATSIRQRIRKLRDEM